MEHGDFSRRNPIDADKKKDELKLDDTAKVIIDADQSTPDTKLIFQRIHEISDGQQTLVAPTSDESEQQMIEPNAQAIQDRTQGVSDEGEEATDTTKEVALLQPDTLSDETPLVQSLEHEQYRFQEGAVEIEPGLAMRPSWDDSPDETPPEIIAAELVEPPEKPLRQLENLSDDDERG